MYLNGKLCSRGNGPGLFHNNTREGLVTPDVFTAPTAHGLIGARRLLGIATATECGWWIPVLTMALEVVIHIKDFGMAVIQVCFAGLTRTSHREQIGKPSCPKHSVQARDRA